MDILNEYPGPWSISVRKLKSGCARIELIDYNGTPIAEIFGETIEQATALASVMKDLPEMLFSKSNK